MSDLIVVGVLILGAALWRAIKVKKDAPKQKHSVTEYADAVLFPDENEKE